MSRKKAVKQMPFEVEKGVLYIVPTPIGNLSDISYRAQEVLKAVDFVAAEDTRVSGKLLSLLGIKKSFMSYHEHNKTQAGQKVAERIVSGESCALVTDAGTPAISDPGEQLVALCRESGIKVVPIPGACAFVTALSASGFDSRRFCFEGFLPPEKSKRAEILDIYKNESKTVIFYEAPHRLASTISELLKAFGDRRICVSRELTKVNEEIVTTTLSEFEQRLREKEPKGEYVLILEGAKAEGKEAFFENLTVEEHVEFYENQGMARMDAIKACAKDRHVPKNEIYKQLL